MGRKGDRDLKGGKLDIVAGRAENPKNAEAHNQGRRAVLEYGRMSLRKETAPSIGAISSQRRVGKPEKKAKRDYGLSSLGAE